MASFFQLRRLNQHEIMRLLLISFFAAALAGGLVLWYRQGKQRQVHRAELGLNLVAERGEFRPVQVVRQFPPLTRFPVIAVSKARDKMNPTELVLGVKLGDEARAYPINMLTGPSREILNDQLGGRPIAATW